MDLIAGWPLPGDDPQKVNNLSVLLGKMRHMKGQPLEKKKAEFFIELFNDHVLKHVVDIGEMGHKDLRQVLVLMNGSIQSASDAIGTNEYEEAFELVLSQVQGIAALVSRDWGFLRSTRSNADPLKNISDQKGGGIYRQLSTNEFYKPLLKEFWDTIDACAVACPKLRAMTNKTMKSAGNASDIKEYTASYKFVQ